MASVAVKSEPTFTLTLDQAELDALTNALGRYWRHTGDAGFRLYQEVKVFSTYAPSDTELE